VKSCSELHQQPQLLSVLLTKHCSTLSKLKKQQPEFKTRPNSQPGLDPASKLVQIPEQNAKRAEFSLLSHKNSSQLPYCRHLRQKMQHFAAP